jgi:Protein of unknown function (DUF2934)
MDIRQQVQERAYALWVEEGCVHGRAEDHWLRAERELSYRAGPEANENEPKPKKRAPAKRRATRRAA